MKRRCRSIPSSLRKIPCLPWTGSSWLHWLLCLRRSSRCSGSEWCRTDRFVMSQCNRCCSRRLTARRDWASRTTTAYCIRSERVDEWPFVFHGRIGEVVQIRVVKCTIIQPPTQILAQWGNGRVTIYYVITRHGPRLWRSIEIDQYIYSVIYHDCNNLIPVVLGAWWTTIKSLAAAVLTDLKWIDSNIKKARGTVFAKGSGALSFMALVVVGCILLYGVGSWPRRCDPECHLQTQTVSSGRNCLANHSPTIPKHASNNVAHIMPWLFSAGCVLIIILSFLIWEWYINIHLPPLRWNLVYTSVISWSYQ